MYFPKHDKADFGEIRKDPKCAYFDRTNYIADLEYFRSKALLFLRPRRFGKSLTLSMLAYFHGVEHKEDYDFLFGVGISCFFFLFPLAFFINSFHSIAFRALRLITLDEKKYKILSKLIRRARALLHLSYLPTSG